MGEPSRAIITRICEIGPYFTKTFCFCDIAFLDSRGKRGALIPKSYSLEKRFIYVRKNFREPFSGCSGLERCKGVAWLGGERRRRTRLRALPEHARVYVLRTDQQTTFRWYNSHYTCGNKIKKATKPATELRGFRQQKRV